MHASHRGFRVLCGVDGSPAAASAVRWSAWLTGRTGGDLVLLHALRRPPVSLGVLSARAAPGPAPGGGLRAAVRSTAAELLERAARGLDDVTAETMIREGDAAHELLAVAEDVEVDLIVVGTRRRGQVRSTLMGSVTTDVVRGSNRPVLIVGEGDAPSGRPDAQVVAGVDPAHEPGAVVRDAAAFAVASGSGLVICHVAPEPPMLATMLVGASAERFEPFTHEAVDAGWLARLTAAAEARGARTHAVIRHGDPARELLELASEQPRPILAIGSRRRTALTSAMLGSVSSAVLMAADGPTLVTTATATATATGADAK